MDKFDDSYLDTFKYVEVKIYKDRFEDAMRQFRTIVQKEKIINQVRDRQSYEKPSAKKRRKFREQQERKRIMDLRAAQVKSGEWGKKQRKKEEKLRKKMEDRLKRQANFSNS
jgi:small subunit ribosomal protein S21